MDLFLSASITNKTSTGQVIIPSTLVLLMSVDLTIIAIGIILHIISILLSVTKKALRKSNQTILLVHLCFISIATLGTNVYACHHKTYGIRFSKLYREFFYTLYINYILNLLLLTTDRLLMALLNLKYADVIKRSYVFVFLALSWVLAILYGFMVHFAKFYKNTFKFAQDTSYIYNGIVLGFTILSYVIITIIVTKSARAAGVSTRKKFKVYITPLLIVLTFFVFNVLPPFIIMKVKLDKLSTKYLVVGMIGLNCVNNLTDAVIYILLQPSIRKRFKKYAKKIGGYILKKEVSSTNTSSQEELIS